VAAGSAAPVPVPTLDARANVDSLVGWPPGPRVVKERAWEDTFMSVPSAENAMSIEREISTVPHRAGTPADYKTAMFVQHRLEADGFETQVVPFEVEFTGAARREVVGDGAAERRFRFARRRAGEAFGGRNGGGAGVHGEFGRW
jgi:hypothetical protein